MTGSPLWAAVISPPFPNYKSTEKLLKQILRLSRQIQRKIGDIPILSVSSFGEAQSIGWLVLGDIPLEGGGGFVFTAFDFDRNNICSVLQHKINLSVFVGIISRFYIKLPPKLL